MTLCSELNAQTLGPKISAEEAARLSLRNDSVLGLGRKASLGLVHLPEESSLDQMLASQSTRPHTASFGEGSPCLATPTSGGGGGGLAGDEPRTPIQTPIQMTPQILQDYQGEIERLKFRLKKRKGKMLQLREELAQAKDNETAALKSGSKYEKHIKRLERESEEGLLKEIERRKAMELLLKNLKRRVQELEFLLEDDEKTGGSIKTGGDGEDDREDDDDNSSNVVK